MRKTLFLCVIFLTFIVSRTTGALPADDSKLDDVLKKVRQSTSSNTIRVIVQTVDPPVQSNFDTVTRLGGKVRRTFKHITGFSAELPESAVGPLSGETWVKRISSDEPVEMKGAARDARDASGAAVAERSYHSLGRGIGIAVIDSGIARVSDLTDSVLYSVDFTKPTAWEDDETDGRWDGILRFDPMGHGTHVAGIIAGNGRNSDGRYAGVAQKAHLINLRVLDSAGKGRTEDVISAIEWAIENRHKQTASGQNLNIRVINLSLGRRPTENAESDPLAAMCRVAVKHGIVVVAAAGNYGRAPNGSKVFGSISSPGIEPAVITVGAMNTWDTASRADDSVASYSSRGPTREGTIKPDIVAPGTLVVSTAARSYSTLASQYPDLLLEDGQYMKLSGTSIATPVVSGAAAAILGENPYLTANAVKAILMYTAERRPESALEVGAGYVNFPGALELATNIDARERVSSYWLRYNGTRLDHKNTIGAQTIVWSETIVWDEMLAMGNIMAYNQPAFSQTIVWGETAKRLWTIPLTTRAKTRQLLTGVFGQTIVWDTLVSMRTPWRGQTIVWDELQAFNASVYALRH
jgi:serine protease AprX